MSEEEKKAIDDLFALTHINGYIDLYTQKEAKIHTLDLSKWQNGVKVLLNLLEKQQKEIEELKEKNKNLIFQLKDEEKELIEVTDKIREKINYYISKDKIREKIKELEEQKEKLKYDGDVCFADYEQFCKNLKFFKEQIEEILEDK